MPGVVVVVAQHQSQKCSSPTAWTISMPGLLSLRNRLAILLGKKTKVSIHDFSGYTWNIKTILHNAVNSYNFVLKVELSCAVLKHIGVIHLDIFLLSYSNFVSIVDLENNNAASLK